jgi:hypothetical protein
MYINHLKILQTAIDTMHVYTLMYVPYLIVIRTEFTLESLPSSVFLPYTVSE